MQLGLMNLQYVLVVEKGIDADAAESIPKLSLHESDEQ
jgi:hypothetical protein